MRQLDVAYVDVRRALSVVDTRKTMPGLVASTPRKEQRRCGHNHRNDLSGADQEPRRRPAVAEAAAAAHARIRHRKEDDTEELREAPTARADAVLLDNMNDEQVRAAVAIVERRRWSR